MDEENKALNEQVEAENNLETPPVSEQEASEEVLAPEVEAEATAEAETEEVKTETEEAPKKGAAQRIRELDTRAKVAESTAQSLAQKLAELTGSNESPVPQVPYQPQVEPGQEVSPEQYKQDVMKQADAIVSLRIKQQDAINRINNEALDTMRVYPQLDPESQDFDRELSDTVNEAVEAYVKVNPYTASVRKFTDRLMKPYQRALTKEVGKATENIARQVSETAVRPSSVKTTEKSDSELTIEEFEKKYGVVQS